MRNRPGPGSGITIGGLTVAKKKKIDMDEIANMLTKDGRQVTSFGWVGDPEKQKEIFGRMGEAIPEITKRGLSKEETKRLVDKRAEEMMKEFKEANIEYETRPVFGTWPLPPDTDED